MILVLDNYDSFTYNLVQYLGEMGATMRVARNNKITVEEIEALAPEGIVISPGPGTPDGAGISLALIRRFHETTPILGVCLGHQAIGQAFGGTVTRAQKQMHGNTTIEASSRRCPRASRPRAITRWSCWTRASPPISRSPPAPRTARSWAFATGAFPSRASSSIPSRS